MAKALGAKVTAMTVTTPFRVFTTKPSMATDTLEQYEKDMAVLASQYLNEAKDIATAAGVPCTLVHVEHEHPYRAIIDTAENRGCDAIEMASHGRRGIAAVLLGSETMKVLTHSAITVIVCRRARSAALG